MGSYSASGERVIQSPAATVYGVIADYREHHPRILPDAFTDLQVESGGVGEGTTIEFGVKVAGRVNRMRATITEPEPGRVLKEAAVDGSVVTTFTVTPEPNDRSRVRIDTEVVSSPGIKGRIEQLFAPRMLARLYEDELIRLERYAQTLTPA